MALGTAVNNGERMKSHSHALDIVDVSFPGDTSYPTDGTADFTQYVRDLLGRDVSIVDVRPLGLNGGYEAIYDAANDKLLMVVKATGVEVGDTTPMQGTTFRMAIYCY